MTPMEGFRDLVWDGDRVVWSNLFKHYVHCLYWTFHIALLCGEEDSLEPVDVPAHRRWDSPPTPQAGQLFDKIWARVRVECELDELAERIAGVTFKGIKHKVRRSELLFYLQTIHRRTLMVIQELFVEWNLMDRDKGLSLNSSRETLLTRRGHFDLLPLVPKIDDSSSDVLFRVFENFVVTAPLRHGFATQDAGKKNAKFLVLDYPAIYIGELRRLLWPEWYTACFAKDYHNSSLWANYGDSHKGACLIFRASEEGLRWNPLFGQDQGGVT